MTPSDGPLELPPGCEPRCRACAHRRCSLAASQARKQAWLAQRLAPWRETLAPLQAVEGLRLGYRDKLTLVTRWTPAQGWAFGFLSRDEFIPVPRCPVHSPRARGMVDLLGRVLPPGPPFPLAFYHQSGAQAVLILKSRVMPPVDWLTASVGEALAGLGLEGLWLNLHPSAGRRLFAKRGWRLLWGEPRSRDALGLIHGPAAFAQLIPDLYARALDEAETFLAPTAGDRVVDLYSGIGASLRRWTARGADTLGVELDGEAVDCARLNAPGARLLRGACAQRIPQLAAWTPGAGRRLAYVNPPRTGLEPAVSYWLAWGYRPRRLGYLSCSAGTLSRDLDVLSRAGYEMRRLTPYDFFPQTYHVETLALLACSED